METAGARHKDNEEEHDDDDDDDDDEDIEENEESSEDEAPAEGRQAAEEWDSEADAEDDAVLSSFMPQVLLEQMKSAGKLKGAGETRKRPAEPSLNEAPKKKHRRGNNDYFGPDVDEVFENNPLMRKRGKRGSRKRGRRSGLAPEVPAIMAIYRSWAVGIWSSATGQGLWAMVIGQGL